jgi:4,5-DOPA dioxygenase extradiol
VSALPSIFLSHGAPTLALDPGPTGAFLDRLGSEIRSSWPDLGAIVVMSPHWVTRGMAVTSGSRAPILHDFGGFPEPLYRLDYQAPGDPAFAQEVQALLREVGGDVVLDSKRGLDHGAWVPLRYMFPDADLPVIQVSLPYPWDPSICLAMGHALAPLASQGVLLLGSGGLTHNLGHYRGQPREAEVLPYVGPFAEWFDDHLSRGAIDTLLDYRQQAPGALLAHPEDDHLMPLFFALGAGGEGGSTRLHKAVTHGILAMDVFAFGAPEGLFSDRSGLH